MLPDRKKCIYVTSSNGVEKWRQRLFAKILGDNTWSILLLLALVSTGLSACEHMCFMI